MINTMDESDLGKKISFHPSGYTPSPRESKVGTQAEVGAGTMKGS